MSRKQNIIWLDVESNGLDENKEKLLQVATLVTDQDLNILDETGYSSYIYYTEKQIAKLKKASVPYVLDMHDQSGVWDSLPDGKPRKVVDAELKAYWEQFTESGVCRLGGNSITLDRNFMRKYLPHSFSHLHYRSFDASSIAGMVEMYAGSENLFVKENVTHEAMDDIRSSIEEFRHYKELLFPHYNGK